MKKHDIPHKLGHRQTTEMIRWFLRIPILSAETLLYTLAQAAEDIGLDVIAHETEFINFKVKGAISFLSDKYLKLVNRLTYAGSNISSININVNMRIVSACNAIDSLSIIWLSDLTNRENGISSNLRLCQNYCIDGPLGFKKMLEEKARWELHKTSTCCLEQIQEVTPYKIAAVRPLISHLTNYSRETNKTFATACKERTNSWVKLSYGLSYMDTPMVIDPQELKVAPRGHWIQSSVPARRYERERDWGKEPRNCVISSIRSLW